jgi:hypothetical protein
MTSELICTHILDWIFEYRQGRRRYWTSGPPSEGRPAPRHAAVHFRDCARNPSMALPPPFGHLLPASQEWRVVGEMPGNSYTERKSVFRPSIAKRGKVARSDG